MSAAAASRVLSPIVNRALLIVGAALVIASVVFGTVADQHAMDPRDSSASVSVPVDGESAIDLNSVVHGGLTAGCFLLILCCVVAIAVRALSVRHLSMFAAHISFAYAPVVVGAKRALTPPSLVALSISRT